MSQSLVWGVFCCGFGLLAGFVPVSWSPEHPWVCAALFVGAFGEEAELGAQESRFRVCWEQGAPFCSHHGAGTVLSCCPPEYELTSRSASLGNAAFH